MVSFTEIPSDTRVPGVYIEIDSNRAVSGLLPGMYKRALVIGQRLSTGNVAANVPTLITNVAQAEAAFGRGSMLAAMCAAFKNANPYTEMWAIALDDDAAGVKATQTVTVTGPATGSGTLTLYIAGQRVRVGVTSGDTAATVATAIATAIGLRTDLPVTAAVVGAVVTLTARHKGEAGNDIDVRHSYRQGEQLPAGIGIAIAAGVTGTANPDVATAIAAIGDTQYHSFVCPYSDSANLDALEAEASRRWTATIMREALIHTAFPGSVATMGTHGTGRNSPFACTMGSGLSPTPPWIWASVLAAVDLFEPVPNRPRQTLALPGVLAPDRGAEPAWDERNILLHDGIATFTVDEAGLVHIERLVTNYQLNAAGVPDIAFLDLETLWNLMYLRFSRRLRIATQFPRCRLADNGTHYGSSAVSDGGDIVTPNDIRDSAFAQALEWIGAGLMEDNLPQFQADYRVERDPSDPNRINEVISPDLVNGLRVVAGKLQFLL
jgi:phage tail sheath gpL-like